MKGRRESTIGLAKRFPKSPLPLANHGLFFDLVGAGGTLLGRPGPTGPKSLVVLKSQSGKGLLFITHEARRAARDLSS